MDRILAFCVRHDHEKDYSFFRVEGRWLKDGSYQRVQNASKDFPNKGAIRVFHHDLGLNDPERPQFGVFEIVLEPSFEEQAAKENAAKYRAQTCVRTIHQIVSLPFKSTEVEAIRGRLKGGISEIIGEPRSKTLIYLKLQDGIICGPFEMKLSSTPRRHIVDELSLQHPRTAWKDSEAIKKIEVVLDRSAVSLISEPLPPHDRLIDFGPPEFALRKVLETAKQEAILNKTFTQNELRDIAEKLAKLGSAEEFKARLHLLQNSLKTLQGFKPEWEGLLQSVQKLPTVTVWLSEQVETLKQQAQADLRTQEKELISKISALTSQLERTRNDLDTLVERNKKLAIENRDLEDAKSEATERLSKEVALRLNEATDNASKFLSEIAVFRGVTGTSSSQDAASVRISFVDDVTATELSSPSDALLHLAQNLIKIGFLNLSVAKRFAAEVLNTILTHQVAFLRGSEACLVARTIAVSLFGDYYGFSHLPVGLTAPPDWIKIVENSSSSKHVSGLLLHGCNRSCWDIVGAYIISAEDYGTTNSKIKRCPATIATLVDGPCGLPLTPTLVSSGPIFHTDAISWKSRIEPQAISPGTLKHIKSTGDNNDTDRESVEEIISLSKKRGNIRFHQNVSRTLSVLPELYKCAFSKDEESPDINLWLQESLFNWWLTPMLLSRGEKLESDGNLADGTPLPSEACRQVWRLNQDLECLL